MGQLQTQTNAPLFYAQRLLSIYNKDSEGLNSQDQHALLTGLWLCVKESWGFWLDELSTYMGLEREAAYQTQDLKVFLQANLPEGQLLQGLLDEPQSWLNQALEKINKPGKRLNQLNTANTSTPELINLVSVDELDESDFAEHILLEFKNYIESVRARQLEW